MPHDIAAENASKGVLGLSACTVLAIMAELDILPLLRCRLVSRHFKELADSEIRVDMRRIVGHYLPDPDGFLAALVKFGAVVSSQAALALFLRDRNILSKDLEVTVKYSSEKAFKDYVRTSLPVVEVLKFQRRPGRPNLCDEEAADGPPHRITTTFKVKGSSRQYIRVVGTGYPSPLGPISCLRNTALLCFFSPVLMGCAYPCMTLRRLGLHRDTARLSYHIEESTRLELVRNIWLVTNAGFRFSCNALDFIVPRPHEGCEHGTGCTDCFPRPPCVRHFYLCQCNMRYWGDRGCLMAVLDPSSAWRDLIVCPDEEGSIFTPWDWYTHRRGRAPRCQPDPLEEDVDDWNCMEGESRIRKLCIHIAPTFVGEDMVYLQD
ncbi:hypothetical protein C8T65DRAFT_698469 [Cerioporus squamosus]|nr:hypothetical protein C8T65DRAFT_698469 [Cerioporus squamosus]